MPLPLLPTQKSRLSSLRLPLLATATVAALVGTPTTVQAGPYGGGYASGDLDVIVAREIERRTHLMSQAMVHFEAGIAYYEDGDCESAVNELRQAYDLMPRGPNTAEHVASLEAWYCEALVCRSEELAIEEARYEEGFEMIQRAVELCPEKEEAIELLARYNDPTDISLGERARSPEFMADVQEVTELLSTGESQVRIGLLDEATVSYQRVLQIDPYNAAARRGLEWVSREKMKYDRAAYNHARVELLEQVAAQWNLPVPVDIQRDINPGGGSGRIVDNATAVLRTKLEDITLDVDFQQMPIGDVLEYLRITSQDQDASGAGINFVLDLQSGSVGGVSGGAAGFGGDGEGAAPDPQVAAADRLVTLNLSNVSMIDLLEFITDQTNTTYTIERGVVVVRSGDGAGLITETFEVPPDFIERLTGGGGSGGGGGGGGDPFGGGGGDPFGSGASSGGGGGRGLSAQAALEDYGIDFGGNGNATFNRTLSRLQVTVTPNQMAIIDDLVDQMWRVGPKQIHITTRFVEVQQGNEDELGFDWLLGQFNLPGTTRAFGGGGTAGNGRPVTGTDYPFVFPSSGGTPVGGSPVGRLRSGDGALSRSAIDGLINSTTAVAGDTLTAPGIFSLAGVFTDPQFQLVIRALNQSTGTDLMTAPSIVVMSGNTGQIEVVREFIYPGDYDPPELPNDVGTFNASSSSGGLLGGGLGQVSSFPVTPATPRDWTTRPVGVILDVTPTVAADNFTISLDLNPQVVEFEGFINYGNPISSPAVNSLGQPISVTITENRILQPIFAVRQVRTFVTIYDGSTVAIGGLMREDVQQTEDKIPLLGDIPIIGRLFQSRAESRFKRNLVVFVTAQLIGPDGQPIKREEALEEPAELNLSTGSGGIGSGTVDLLDLK